MSQTGNNKEGNFWFAMVDMDFIMDESFTAIDKSVYTTLCGFADRKTRKCWPGVKTIAKKAGCCERAVQTSLKTLEERGLIERTPRFVNGRQTSSVYHIIGYKAKCYENNHSTPSTPSTPCTGGVQDMHPENESQVNIKDSLTRGACLPNLADKLNAPETPETPEETASSVEQPVSTNPKEVYTPNDAPEIMRPTAELLLVKTRRKGLTGDEITALRTLSATHYPARVQKEVYTACERFVRNGHPLETLTFCYIAGALKYQPSLKRRRKTFTAKPKPVPAKVPERTPEEVEADMARIAELQAKFDAEDEAYGI